MVLSLFEEKVLRIVRSIPSGKVMSYGQIALYAGCPNHAREAGAAMRTLGPQENFPWWRVLNSAGKLSIADNPQADAHMQQSLLEKEGVEFRAPLQLDMARYRHHARETELKALGLDDLLTRSAMHKYGESPNQSLGI